MNPGVQHSKSSDCWLLSSPHTDNELATRFIDQNERKLRFVVEWGKWMFWDAKRWQLDNGDNLALRLARRFANDLWNDFAEVSRRLKSDDARKLHSFVRSANNHHTVKAFLNLARADERIAIRLEELNKYTQLINLEDGTFNLETGCIEPHSQEDHLTQIARVTYDEGADCLEFKKAINLIFNNDDELIRYVRQLLGYSITGDCGEHILPIAYGSGCNGKSFLWNTILRILGDYAGLANDSLLLGFKDSHPTEKAFLYQKRFVPISEPEQSAKLKESRVKELTGDATVTARRMHEDFWSFTRTHTFWLSTNHLPRITGNDEGIWRRIKLIPFEVDLRKVTNPIPDLDRILFETEASGIFNWLVGGYNDYRANGFVVPKVVIAATGDYRVEEDEIALFIADCCIVGPQYMVSSHNLFGAYQHWGGKLNRTVFGKVMGERFDKRTPTAGEFRRVTMYDGIGLPQDAPLED